MAHEVSLRMIARRVRAEMAAQRKTQGQLAEALGLSTTVVGRRMRGEAGFSATELVATAEFLGLTVDQLLDVKAPAERAS